MKEFFQSTAGMIVRIVLYTVLIIAVIWFTIFTLQSAGLAEEDGIQCWVLCHPDSYVALRTGPSKRAEEFGGALCGAELWTNNRKSSGFLRVFNVPAEYDTGWIHTGYIVYDEPHEVYAEMTVRSDGRVAIRKSVGGKIKAWAKDGDKIYVLWMSESWAVTSKGYMMSRFLKAGDEE